MILPTMMMCALLGILRAAGRWQDLYSQPTSPPIEILFHRESDCYVGLYGWGSEPNPKSTYCCDFAYLKKAAVISLRGNINEAERQAVPWNVRGEFCVSLNDGFYRPEIVRMPSHGICEKCIWYPVMYSSCGLSYDKGCTKMHNDIFNFRDNFDAKALFFATVQATAGEASMDPLKNPVKCQTMVPLIRQEVEGGEPRHYLIFRRTPKSNYGTMYRDLYGVYYVAELSMTTKPKKAGDDGLQTTFNLIEGSDTKHWYQAMESLNSGKLMWVPAVNIFFKHCDTMNSLCKHLCHTSQFMRIGDSAVGKLLAYRREKEREYAAIKKQEEEQAAARRQWRRDNPIITVESNCNQQ